MFGDFCSDSCENPVDHFLHLPRGPSPFAESSCGAPAGASSPKRAARWRSAASSPRRSNTAGTEGSHNAPQFVHRVSSASPRQHPAIARRRISGVCVALHRCGWAVVARSDCPASSCSSRPIRAPALLLPFARLCLIFRILPPTARSSMAFSAPFTRTHSRSVTSRGSHGSGTSNPNCNRAVVPPIGNDQ